MISVVKTGEHRTTSTLLNTSVLRMKCSKQTWSRVTISSVFLLLGSVNLPNYACAGADCKAADWKQAINYPYMNHVKDWVKFPSETLRVNVLNAPGILGSERTVTPPPPPSTFRSSMLSVQWRGKSAMPQRKDNKCHEPWRGV